MGEPASGPQPPARAPASPSPALPGYPTTEDERTTLGFSPLGIRVNGAVPLPDGMGSEWGTVGDAPDGPGLYLFTVEDGDDVRVVYVGRTKQLLMVTKGYAPRQGGRGGNRYGRPHNAQRNRVRINLLLTERLVLGRLVRHWVRPLAHPIADQAAMQTQLATEEEDLIVRWHLREVGWNVN